MTARAPFRVALGFVIGYCIAGPMVADEQVHLVWPVPW